MRITNGMIFNNSQYYMQSSLGDLVESNIQGGTQKQINRPSDNPASAALILNTRNEISNTTQYERNVDTARGWLSMADDTYQQLSTVIISIKELALQASTGHLTETNREEISYQLDQLFGQVLNLSNTEYEGNSIFGGHNYTESAYDQVLGVSTKDENIDTSLMRVSGASDESLAIRFLGITGADGSKVGANIGEPSSMFVESENGTVQTQNMQVSGASNNEIQIEFLGAGNIGDPAAIPYQWSNDGGTTWNTGTLPGGATQITVDNVTLDMQAGTAVSANDTLTITPRPIEYEWSNDGGLTWTSASLPGNETSMNLGGVVLEMQAGTPIKAAANVDERNSTDDTILYIHPTAQYNGDANDASAYPTADTSLAGTLPIEKMDMAVNGSVDDNVRIQITNGGDLAVSGTIEYDVMKYDSANNTWETIASLSEKIPNPATKSIILPFSDGLTESSIEIDMTAAQTRDNATVPPTISGTATLPMNMVIDIQPRRVDMAGSATVQVTADPAVMPPVVIEESPTMLMNAQGAFEHNVIVRLDNEVNLLATPGAPDSVVDYSYSMDGGRTWIAAQTQVQNDENIRLPIPGGYVDVEAGFPTPAPPATITSKTIGAGTQFTVHPDRADLEYEIMEDTYVDVNQVGKDTFGGVYQGASVGGPNLFETIGKLIAYTEYNDVDGISKMYAELTNVQEHVLTQATKVGGIENRLDLAEDVLSATKLDQQERLSYAEDIDLTTLMNNLAKQELTYTTVLQSTSQILQLNLMQYL